MRVHSEVILPVSAERYWNEMRNEASFHKFEDRFHKAKSRSILAQSRDAHGRLTGARCVRVCERT